MSGEDDGRKILAQTIDAYCEQRKKFVVGFVRFVLERGLQTPAPQRDRKPPETWRDAGRRLYGAELFEATLKAEVEARRAAHAEGRVSAVRGGEGKDARERGAARGGKDQRG